MASVAGRPSCWVQQELVRERQAWPRPWRDRQEAGAGLGRREGCRHACRPLQAVEVTARIYLHPAYERVLDERQAVVSRDGLEDDLAALRATVDDLAAVVTGRARFDARFQSAVDGLRALRGAGARLSRLSGRPSY